MTGNSMPDKKTITDLLLGSWSDTHKSTRKLLENSSYWKAEGEPMKQHRERVFKQLQLLAPHGIMQQGFPKTFGGKNDPGATVTAFANLLLADPSLQIKAGVQWGLYTAAIYHLGTDPQHHKYLPNALTVQTPGIFAMTETGHGSNVADLATTATYNHETRTITINTPHRGATKDYLGNAALHGKAAVVFAQLIVNNINHGVHAFHVPIRNENGELYPGISSSDDEYKGGLNGIDNGRLTFHKIEIPVTDLLNRYGNIDENGQYTSPISNPNRRFFTMLSTLVQGRVSLVSAATIASQLSLNIATTYANERRQFHTPDQADYEPENILLNYQTHQRKLLPLLAKTYAITFASEKLVQQFHETFTTENPTDEQRINLETLAATLKPYSTWHALNTLQTSREACGGQGFLAINRFTSLKSDLDIYATFEGDNTVLYQLAAKRILGDYSATFKETNTQTASLYIIQHASDAAINKTGIRKLAQNITDFGSTARSVGHIQTEEHQHQLIAERLHAMTSQLADKLKHLNKNTDPKTVTETINNHQQELINLTEASAELYTWEAFTETINNNRDNLNEDDLQKLINLRDLYGFTLLEQHLDWYLIHGRISPHRAQAITEYINTRLLPRTRQHAQELVDAFAFSETNLRAPIALGKEYSRSVEAQAWTKTLHYNNLLPEKEK